MKTITLSDAAYERLKAWKTGEDSFSTVVLRMVPKRGTFSDLEDAFRALPKLSTKHSRTMGRGWGQETSHRMNVDRLVAADFLLDRWRNGDGSAASTYARAHLEDSLAIPWIVKGEFLRCAAFAERDSAALLEFLARYPTLWPDEETVIGYGRLGAALRRQSLSLGATDLWLAAATLQLGVPLVTRDGEGIGKVPGIRIDPF